MKYKNMSKRIWSSCLAFVLLLSSFVTVSADSLGDGYSQTVTIQMNEKFSYLETTNGNRLNGYSWSYTTDDGITGPAYCVNWGLNNPPPDKKLKIAGKYTASPQTIGAFAGGYPQLSLEDFIQMNREECPEIVNLKSDEYACATQIAVWATLGQIAVEGTDFTQGRATLAVQHGDARNVRTYKALEIILRHASELTKLLSSGMHIRLGRQESGNALNIEHAGGLTGAAQDHAYGIQLETINGVEYYTRSFVASSATSTFKHNYCIELWAENAPEGTIFTDLENQPLETVEWNDQTLWRLPTPNSEKTDMNANGSEYAGDFKICLPVKSVKDSGDVAIHAASTVMQYHIYLAENPDQTEQSYIIADPLYTSMSCTGTMKWNKEASRYGRLVLNKTDGMGNPLPGAIFKLVGTDGSTFEGTSNEDGQVVWEFLNPDIQYTLTETQAPDGYFAAEPMTVSVPAGQTQTVSIKNNSERYFRIRKIDAQNGSPLIGATFRIEQTDGSFETEVTTGHSGVIEWKGAELPYGSYKIYEIQAPEGYEKDTEVKTFTWDGKADKTLVFQNVRTPSFVLIKMDEETHESLAGASFRVYKDGQLITTVTTDNAGYARVSGLSEGYYEVEEVIAPEGYCLDSTRYGIHIDPYDPALNEDPVLVLKNKAKPGLIIVKYDAQTMRPMPDTTFAVYHDTTLIGQYTTDENGEIRLNGLEDGTYTVEEIAADSSHVVQSRPQSIELTAERKEPARLVFLNELKPGIHITKLDEETMRPLSGAVFRISKVGDSFTKEYTTGQSGEIDLSDLEPGTYTVQEIDAPFGYALNTEIRTFEVRPGETVQLVFTNQAKPSLVIVKYDEATKKSMPDTVFEVYRDTFFIGSFTTDENGKIELSGLEDGTYTVKEVSTDSSHIVQSCPQSIEIKAGQAEPAKLIFLNKLKPGIHFVKLDSETMEPLAGATFRIAMVNGSFIKDFTTGLDGTVNLQDLEPGVYTVTETSAPDGYELNTEVRTFEAKANEDVQLVFTNTKKPNMEISKIDAETGRPLEGAVFRIAKIGDGTRYYDRKTDAEGKILLEGLNSGIYSVQEIIAPSGYQRNSTEYHVELFAGETSKLIVKNHVKPSLRIIKYDMQTGKAMAGTTFEVYRDAELTGTYTTDENGQINLSNLKPGTYLVKEIATDDSHVVNSTPQQIEIKEDSKNTAVLVFLNQQKPYIRLVKLDSETMKPLPNAKFLIEQVGGSFSKEYTTDENGEIKLEKLDGGAYTVQEIKAPDGYLIDDSIRTIQLNPDEYATFVFTDTKKPSIKIVKYDPVKDIYLPGALFRIAKIEDGSHYMDRLTDFKGEIVIDNLEPGMYSVKEIAAPSGYVVNDMEYHVELFGGKQSQLVVVNEHLPSLKIMKTDANTDMPIPGTKFTVKKADGETISTVVTNENGEVIMENMEPGVYEIIETSVPAGYLLDSTPQYITLAPNQTGTVHFKNYPKPSLVINKVDSITGDPLKDAKFSVVYASNNTFTGEINDLGTYYSDENGRIELTNLKDGWYKVTELEAPKGYALQEPNVQEFYIKGGESKEVTFENTPLSALVIKKVDGDTAKALQGAKFRVRYLSGASGTGGTVIGEYTTSAQGTIVITGLKAGTYVVEETKAPDGYIMNDAPETVYLSGKDQDVVTVEFENYKDGGLIIQKLDSETKQPLAGAKFKVTTSDGTLIANQGGAVSSNGIYTTDQNGQIRITGIEAGTTLVVMETEAPDGYVLETVSQTVKIDKNDVQTLTFYNKPDSGLIITKLDKRTGEPLYGSVFKVTKDDGSVVGNANGLYRTDRNGMIHIYDLETDTYIVKEVEAPDGYTLDSRPKTIKLRSGETHELTFYNESIGGIRITKLDEETRQPLKNAEFEVEYMNGKRVGTFRTNSNGVIDIDGLPNGWYTIVEKCAPKGYQLDSEPHDVEVKDGKITQVTLTNRKTSAFLIHKVDSSTGKGIYGVTYLLSDRNNNPIGQYTSDQNGYVYIDDRQLSDGKYYIREISVPEGYIIDSQVKTFYVEYGATSSITWYNTPTQGQIQIVKKSADDNAINGLPAGSLLEGAAFEIYDRGGNIVDTIVTDKNGRASSKTLPLGIYTIRETQAPPYYSINETVMTANLEFSGQILTFEVLDKSVSTGVSIIKRGYNEVMPNQPIVYTFSNTANTSSVPLSSFYWRDTLPSAIRADKLVTGTYNQELSYKIVYQTNWSNGEYRTINDNLSTSRNYALDISNTALGLADGEYITEILFVFGNVKAGFAQVEAPYLYATTVSGLPNGSSFVNQADVGGVYNGQWITSVSRWVTKVYNYTQIEIPKTGY